MSLNVAVLGSGLGGLAAAISLRRQGHKVTLYERYDFAGEVGSNISCASNGTRSLEKWGVDIQRARPVILTDMVWHDWAKGEITSQYPSGDYKGKFGTHYYSFHRPDIHTELKRTATMSEGEGPPAKLLLNHKAIKVDADKGWVKIENGLEITADLVVAADGIRVSNENIIMSRFSFTKGPTVKHESRDWCRNPRYAFFSMLLPLHYPLRKAGEARIDRIRHTKCYRILGRDGY
jgi:salicylate hydroxylase